jgi:hypothetical protein
MPETDISYYTSERFIHDDIVREAEAGLKSLYDTWSKHSCISPFALVWPYKPVNFHGHKTESVLPFDLPADRSKWTTELRRIADAASAYAVLLVEQRAGAVVVILESVHGTKSWHIPIENHGNVNVLGDRVEKTDTDSIGLLWSPKQGAS